MKAFAQILALLILFCSAVPCADGAVGSDHEAQLVQVGQETERDHEHGEDLCSPFCSCHCCHKHTLFDQPLLGEEEAIFAFNRHKAGHLPEEPLLEEPDPPRS